MRRPGPAFVVLGKEGMSWSPFARVVTVERCRTLGHAEVYAGKMRQCGVPFVEVARTAPKVGRLVAAWLRGE